MMALLILQLLPDYSNELVLFQCLLSTLNSNLDGTSDIVDCETIS